MAIFGVKLPRIYNPWFVALIATLGGALFGFDISSMSAIIGTDQYRDYFNNPAGVVQGGINSALAAGSVLGSLFAGPLSNYIGRRNSIAVACVPWMIGTALQAAVNGVGMLIAGRVLNGVTVGITSSQVPVYLAEIAKREKRGSLIIIQQLAIEWGILIMFFIGFGCSYIDGPASFRTAWSMQFIPCLFLIIGLPFLPESPRWLAMKDRNEEAIEILGSDASDGYYLSPSVCDSTSVKKLGNVVANINPAGVQAGGNRNDPLVVAEWEDIQMTIAAERAALPGWRKFVYRGMWKRTVAGFTVQMWQQNSGANVMTYYVVYIFAMADLQGEINLIASGVQYALFIVFTGVMFFYVDKVGRRPLLIWGAIIMGVCHMIVGGLLSMGTVVPGGVNGDENVPILLTGSPAYAVIAFSYMLIIVYAMTLAPICWIYAAEVWSLETRAVGMSIAAIGNWLFNFALGLYIPPGFINIRYAMFIIFGLMCFLAAAQFFLTYPETANKTLEEVEDMFATGGPHAWKTKRGESRLDALMEDATTNKLTIDDVSKDPAGKRVGSLTHSIGDHVEDAAAAADGKGGEKV